MTLFTLVLLAAFVSLGRWQWHRGEAKQATWDEYARVGPALPVKAGEIDTIARFARVSLAGRFEGDKQFLLDNISHAGQPGYEVLTPYRLENGRHVLVNRGWVAFTGFRDRLPDVSWKGAAERAITGRVEELPAAGLASGRAPPDASAPWPKVTSFPTQAELEAALGDRLTRRIVLLDEDVKDGLVREWTPPGLPPDRHFSYAIQWWGFALVLLVLYFGLNFRKVP